MENNENLVIDEIAENVEQTTEETPQSVKTYTQKEVDAIVGKAKALKETKLRKEYDRKYGGLVETLRAGTGKDTVEEIESSLKEFYQDQGVDFTHNNQSYSASDLNVLAQADADEIIRNGYDEVTEEAERLNKLGANGMTEREKIVLAKLTDHIRSTESRQKLDKLGVSKDVYEADGFKEFSKLFNAGTPIEKVYEIYAQSHPKKQVQTMGSMKHTATADDGVKDYYTPAEAKRFTVADFDKNPELLKAVERSMQKW